MPSLAAARTAATRPPRALLRLHGPARRPAGCRDALRGPPVDERGTAGGLAPPRRALAAAHSASSARHRTTARRSARAAEREGVGELIAYAPRLDDPTLAALIAEARAVLLPALSDASGLGALDALAAGTPVVASATGALPDLVGGAGFLVEPRDPARLAAALRAAWSDDAVHGRLVAAARQAPAARRRTWRDVALETRRIYAEVGSAAGTLAARPRAWIRGCPRPGRRGAAASRRRSRTGRRPA